MSAATFDRSVSLVCWAYNEEELIEGFLRRADRLMKSCVRDYEIVVVDDGSTDRTNALIRGLMREIPALRLITSDVNRDVGVASYRAIQSASKEFLFWQTIDWSYDLSRLRDFLELLKSHDVVAGVRRAPGVRRLFNFKHVTTRSDNRLKAVISITNYLLIRLLYGLPMSDYQNIVFYRTAFVRALNCRGKSSFINPKMLLHAYWSGCSIVEVPIPFLPRQAGKAKGTRPKALLASVTDILGYWPRWSFAGEKGMSRRGTVRRLRPAEWNGLDGYA